MSRHQWSLNDQGDAMSSSLKVGVAQINSTDDWKTNWEQVEYFLNNKSQNLDLVCFPENTLFFRIHGPLKSEVFSLKHKVYADIQKWVDQHNTMVMIGGTPIEQDQKIYNATLVFEAGKPMNVAYKKVHLFDVVLDGMKIQESAYFKAGDHLSVIELKGWRLGLSICYDIRFPELYRSYFHNNVDAVLIPSAFTVPTGKAHWEILNRARAIENQFYVISAAQGGTHQSCFDEGYRNTFGHSMIVDPWGDIAAISRGESPDFLVCELEKDRLKYVSERMPVKNHVRGITL